MTPLSDPSRRYSVRVRHLEPRHGQVVAEASFEAAAVAYVEDFHPPMTQDHEISVIVREVNSGHEHCFRIDLESGETQPCG